MQTALASFPSRPGNAQKHRRGLSRIDGRTKLGRFMRDTERELLFQLGDEPSEAQRLLVRAVVIKAARLSQLQADLIESSAQAGPEDYQRLAWLNSLSKDLAELGLKPQREGKGYRAPDKRGTGGITPAKRDGGTLAEYAAQRQGCAA